MAGRILRGLLSIIGNKFLVLSLGLFITPVLVRMLGSSSYGDYTFMLSVLGIAMIFVNAGIFDGTRKYMSENHDQSGWLEQVFGFYLRIAFVLAIITALGFMAFSKLGFSRQLFGPAFTTYFYLISGLLVGRQASSLVRGGLMGLGMEQKSEPLKVIQKLLFGVFGILLLHLGYGVTGVLIGHIVATVTVSAIGFIMIFRHLDAKTVISRASDSLPKGDLLSFNGLSVVLTLMTASLYHVDILLLKPITGSQATGYYRASLVLAQFLWFVPKALQTMFLHSSSELWSEGETEQISELVSRATRYNLALSLLLTIGLATLASDFVPLYYGSEFKPSVLPLLLLLPGALGFALARPIIAVGQGKGKLRILIVATGTTALLNLVMNLLLIPRYGMAGAAVATSTSYGSMFVFHIWSARRIGFNPTNEIRALRIFTVAILTAPVVFGVSSVIESSIVSLVVVPPLGFVVYAILSIKLGAISLSEISEITN